MGMYDEIHITCPHCKESIFWQSKAGDCKMTTFGLESMPAEIANDLLSDKVWCEHCGKRIIFRVRIKVIVEAESEDA